VVGQNHLKFKVRQNERVLDVIAFGMGGRLGDLEVGRPNLSVAFVLEENRWQGRACLQMRAKDLRVSGGEPRPRIADPRSKRADLP